jgi:hypothetical protein
MIIIPEQCGVILDEGVGYKIFVRDMSTGTLRYISCFLQEPYTASADHWIRWDSKIQGQGFCFFLSAKEARRFLDTLKFQVSFETYSKHVIHRILYKGGLCHQQEMINSIPDKSFTVGICKAFRIQLRQRKMKIRSAAVVAYTEENCIIEILCITTIEKAQEIFVQELKKTNQIGDDPEQSYTSDALLDALASREHQFVEVAPDRVLNLVYNDRTRGGGTTDTSMIGKKPEGVQ